MQVAQLGQDREELRVKLERLELLVKRVVVKDGEVEQEVVDAVQEQEQQQQEKEKILELLSEIGSDSNSMMARWESSNSSFAPLPQSPAPDPTPAQV